MVSVYIHIPFCEKKCNYCAFLSFCPSNAERKRYLSALIDEIERYDGDNVAKTIYFGGGTPSLLTTEELGTIFQKLRQKFEILSGAEITIEVNPNSISEEKVKFYREMGINRVSVGVQSLNNKTLKKIGRLHSKRDVKLALKTLSKYYDNISADLILGLENEKNVCHYAKKLLKWKVKHISAYMLEVHKNTPLFEAVNRGEYRPLSADGVTKSYERLVKFLKKHHFFQYEVSNFAINGFESKHNLSYWSYGDYVGFGISAHSFLGGVRSANSSNLKGYYAGEKNCEKIDGKMEIEERIMLGLRSQVGVSRSALKKLGYDIALSETYRKLLKEGVIREVGDRFYLNEKFYKFADYHILNLIP